MWLGDGDPWHGPRSALDYALYAGDSLAGEQWHRRKWPHHGGREDLVWLGVAVCLRL